MRLRGNAHFIAATLLILALSGCNENNVADKAGKTPGEEDSKEAALSGEVELRFVFNRDKYDLGEAVCLRITLYNGTEDSIGLDDFPMKNLRLRGPEGMIREFRRAPYAKPPKMQLSPGDTSSDVVNLTGVFENAAPGMLEPGEYTVYSGVRFFKNRQIKLRMEGFELADSASFEVSEPRGDSQKALEEYLAVLSEVAPPEELAGKRDLRLDEKQLARLDSIAGKYPDTPVGRRITINDLGIWYRAVSLDRYDRFMENIAPECPCCLHRRIVDRLIKRYVISREREQILDIVEENLERYPAGTPVGDYLREAFAFRMEHGMLVR